MTSTVPVLDLGLSEYQSTQSLQQHLRRAVAAGHLPGVILLLEHPPVITLGNRGGSEDLRASAEGVPVIRSERGGAATLHAPGQLVSYPILPIPGRDVRRYVAGLEEVLCLVLAGVGLAAERRAKRPGLYVNGRKIASVGLRIERWVASHGTSLNVDLDLSLFDTIISCGEQHLRQTSILDLLGSAPAMKAVKEEYVKAFAQVFSIELVTSRTVSAEQATRVLGLPVP